MYVLSNVNNLISPPSLQGNTMKLRNLFISLILITLLSACGKALEPIEGEQYKQLPQTFTNEQFAPVTEVFSLTCGHCRKMEDLIPDLQKAVGRDIAKMHITFNESAYIGAMLYYAAEMQSGGIPDHQFMIDLFATLQMPKGTTSEQQKAAMVAVFESRDLISPINYDQQQLKILSDKVDRIARLSEQTKIQSVPTFVVNGKYQVLSGGHNKPEDIANTINYLLAK
jgi:thiol-disulfide isomerase/thioredoxin